MKNSPYLSSRQHGLSRCGLLWVNPDRVFFDSMRRDKATCKLAIRNKEKTHANEFSDSLNDALSSKDMNMFWKSWRSKFG